MAKQVPLVNYLVIDDGDPHLVAQACDCGALYFDRRVACASCGKRGPFGSKKLANEGTVSSFTIIHRGAPGIPAPFVSAVVALEGGGVVKANLVDVEASPDAVKLGMPVRFATRVIGTDDDGTEAVAFGYIPA
jgi:uncharacterized OB-fold protein